MATKKYLDLAGLQHFKEKNDLRYPVLEDALIPSRYLPSYVDDVLEYGCKAADESYVDAQGVSHTPDAGTEAFPAEGESGKIYVSKFSNKTYRWSGTQYTEISASLVLGDGAGSAYPGDMGKANAEAIAQEINDRKAAINTLFTNLRADYGEQIANASTRITNAYDAADRTLFNRIQSLERGLSTEINDRQAAVGATQMARNQLAEGLTTAYKAADTALGERIDGVVAVNGTQQTAIEKNAADITALQTARRNSIHYVQTAPDFDGLAKPGVENVIFVMEDTNKIYRWDGSNGVEDYVELSSQLKLGETADTAYPGQLGASNATAIATETAMRTSEITRVEGLIAALGNDIDSISNNEIDYLFG